MGLESGKSGRDQYASHYEERLEKQAEWLKLGARQKADSIINLLAANKISPRRLLELGSGTGAVLSLLKEDNVAKEFYAIDFSKDAIEYLRRNIVGVKAEVADIMEKSHLFGNLHFDVVVLTHTLEHLENPEGLLKKIGDISMDFLIVEVPLEDLAIGRLKSNFIPRSKHSAGHVQFYSKETFGKIVKTCGYEIIRQHIYAPILEKSSLTQAYSGGSKVKLSYKYLTEYYFPKYFPSLWTKYYHAHMAVLCRKTN